MSTTLEWLHHLHQWNRWLMLAVGSASLALLLVRIKRPVPISAVLRGFVATLHLQVLLGLLIYAVQQSQHLPIFGGQGGGAHMLGGVAAAVFGWLALRHSRLDTRPGLTLLWCALALLVPASRRPLETLVLLSTLLVVAWVWPRPDNQNPTTGRS